GDISSHVAVRGANPKLMSAGKVTLGGFDAQPELVKTPAQSFSVFHDARSVFPAATLLKLFERDPEADRRGEVMAADHFELCLVDAVPQVLSVRDHYGFLWTRKRLVHGTTERVRAHSERIRNDSA